MNIWDMNPIEWYAALSNFSVWLIITDIFLSCCITKSNWSKVFIRRHVVAYSVLFIGWFVMHIGVNLKSMDALVKVSLLGWLIWLIGIFFIARVAYKKMRSPKNNLGEKTFLAISFIMTSLFKILKKLYPIVILLPLVAIASCADRWWFEKDKN